MSKFRITVKRIQTREFLIKGDYQDQAIQSAVGAHEYQSSEDEFLDIKELPDSIEVNSVEVFDGD